MLGCKALVVRCHADPAEADDLLKVGRRKGLRVGVWIDVRCAWKEGLVILGFASWGFLVGNRSSKRGIHTATAVRDR